MVPPHQGARVVQVVRADPATNVSRENQAPGLAPRGPPVLTVIPLTHEIALSPLVVGVVPDANHDRRRKQHHPDRQLHRKKFRPVDGTNSRALPDDRLRLVPRPSRALALTPGSLPTSRPGPHPESAERQAPRGRATGLNTQESPVYADLTKDLFHILP